MTALLQQRNDVLSDKQQGNHELYIYNAIINLHEQVLSCAYKFQNFVFEQHKTIIKLYPLHAQGWNIAHVFVPLICDSLLAQAYHYLEIVNYYQSHSIDICLF